MSTKRNINKFTFSPDVRIYIWQAAPAPDRLPRRFAPRNDKKDRLWQ